jgi:hypothetical protein
MTIHREIGPSYQHKPIVQGVNYSPLMVEIKQKALVKIVAEEVHPEDEDGNGEAVEAAGRRRRPPRRAAALGGWRLLGPLLPWRWCWCGGVSPPPSRLPRGGKFVAMVGSSRK